MLCGCEKLSINLFAVGRDSNPTTSLSFRWSVATEESHPNFTHSKKGRKTKWKVNKYIMG